MSDIYNIKIKKESQSPLYKQLANGIIKLIDNGILLPNSRLPSIRKLSQKMNINNTTVVNAYRYLENKKIVYSKAGSGTYISALPIKYLKSNTIIKDYKTKGDIQFNLRDAINFAAGNACPTLFPVIKFKELFGEVLERDKGNTFNYEDSKGYLPLRESLCLYLEQSKINTSPEKVYVLSGINQGFDIISKAILSFGDVIFVEGPTYHRDLSVFISRGIQIIEINMDDDGMNISELERLIKIYKPKLIHMTSYFQIPTCVSYSYKKKLQVLEIAKNYNIYIIEEDTQSEIVYTSKKIVPLKSLDYNDKVIYIKNFSKILIPGLRIGFMTIPNTMIKDINNLSNNNDAITSSFVQKAFHLYLKNEYLKNHTQYMIETFRERHNTAILEIEQSLKPYINYTIPNGGVSIWIKLNNVDIEYLCNTLIKNKVVVTPGSMFSLRGESTPYIHICFAHVDTKDIKRGIKIIGNTLRENKKLF